jgi:hypothetical protein
MCCHTTRILVKPFATQTTLYVIKKSFEVLNDSACFCNRNAKNSDTERWRNISCCERKHGECFVLVCTEKTFIVICQFSYHKKLNISTNFMLVYIIHLGSLLYMVLLIVTVCIFCRRVINSRRMIWVGHIAQVWAWEICTKIWTNNLKEWDLLGDISADGFWRYNFGGGGLDWVCLCQDTNYVHVWTQ